MNERTCPVCGDTFELTDNQRYKEKASFGFKPVCPDKSKGCIRERIRQSGYNNKIGSF